MLPQILSFSFSSIRFTSHFLKGCCVVKNMFQPGLCINITLLNFTHPVLLWLFHANHPLLDSYSCIAINLANDCVKIPKVSNFTAFFQLVLERRWYSQCAFEHAESPSAWPLLCKSGSNGCMANLSRGSWLLLALLSLKGQLIYSASQLITRIKASSGWGLKRIEALRINWICSLHFPTLQMVAALLGVKAIKTEPLWSRIAWNFDRSV